MVIHIKSQILFTIAKNVKKHRLELNLSQERLAEIADLHPNYIGLIERAKCNISIITLEKLAKALRIKIIDLLED